MIIPYRFDSTAKYYNGVGRNYGYLFILFCAVFVLSIFEFLISTRWLTKLSTTTAFCLILKFKSKYLAISGWILKSFGN